MQHRALSNRAIALLVVTGAWFLIVAVLLALENGGGAITGIALEFPTLTIGIMVPLLLAGLLSSLGELPALQGVFPEMPFEAVARLLFVLACTAQLWFFVALQGDRVLLYRGGVTFWPGISAWFMWLALGGIGFLLFGANVVPALRVGGGSQAAVWAAVPEGTLDVLGEPVPSGVWLRLVQRSPDVIVLSSTEGMSYRLHPTVQVHLHQEGTQS